MRLVSCPPQRFLQPPSQTLLLLVPYRTPYFYTRLDPKEQLSLKYTTVLSVIFSAVILADSRYNRQDKRSKFPPWITQFLGESALNLSVDVAVAQVSSFIC